MNNGDHYPSSVYLPTATLGVCRNAKNCKNGLYPPYKVTLGDGWCMDCYDKKIVNYPHPINETHTQQEPHTAFP